VVRLLRCRWSFFAGAAQVPNSGSRSPLQRGQKKLETQVSANQRHFAQSSQLSAFAALDLPAMEDWARAYSDLIGRALALPSWMVPREGKEGSAHMHGGIARLRLADFVFSWEAFFKSVDLGSVLFATRVPTLMAQMDDLNASKTPYSPRWDQRTTRGASETPVSMRDSQGVPQIRQTRAMRAGSRDTMGPSSASTMGPPSFCSDIDVPWPPTPCRGQATGGGGDPANIEARELALAAQNKADVIAAQRAQPQVKPSE
jgi:hypothetical protein